MCILLGYFFNFSKQSSAVIVTLKGERGRAQAVWRLLCQELGPRLPFPFLKVKTRCSHSSAGGVGANSIAKRKPLPVLVAEQGPQQIIKSYV